MTTKYTRRIICLLLSLAVILSCVGCSKSKESEKERKKCSGTVEDYMEYLIRGQKDKLSRYCKAQSDPFQKGIDSKEAKTYWSLLKNMDYVIQETTVKDKKGVVTVKLSVLDAAELVKKAGESFSLKQLDEVDKDSEKRVEENIDLMVNYDDKIKAYCIESTDPVYQVVKKQVDKIIPNIRTVDEDAVLQTVGSLMDAYYNADYKYIAKNSSTPGVTDYSENVFYKVLYKEEASYLSYSVDILSEGEKVDLVIHCQTKRAEPAWKRVLSNADNLTPLMVPMIPALLQGSDFFDSEEELFKLMDFGAMIPKLKSEMEKEPVVEIDIPCVLEVRDNGVIEPNVHGNFKEILPVADFTEFAPDYDVDVTEMYLKAANLANEKGVITGDQFKICQLAMSERQKSKEEIISILQKHDYVSDSYNTAGEPMDDSFVNEKMAIHFEIVECENFEDTYERVYDDYDEIHEMVESGELKGEITGGPLYMVYSGSSPEDYAVDSLRCYLIVANDYYFRILVLGETPEKVDNLEAMLDELGLKPN